MRGVFVFCVGLVITASWPAGAQEVRVVDIKWDDYCPNYLTNYPISPRHQVNANGAGVRVEVADWRELQNAEAVQKLLNSLLPEAARRCPQGNADSIDLWQRGVSTGSTSSTIIFTRYWRQPNLWQINSKVLPIVKEQAKERAREAARIEQEKRRKEAQEKEVRRKAALADCGDAPTISEGPWFSSTYKIAVLDKAKEAVGQGWGPLCGLFFLCIKRIEYTSPAPNRYGGNAARVRFIGYDGCVYLPKTEVLDIIY